MVELDDKTRETLGRWGSVLGVAVLVGPLIGSELHHQRERAKALLKFVDGIPISNKLKFQSSFTREAFIRIHGSVLGGTIYGIQMGLYFVVRDFLAEKRGVRDFHNHFAGNIVGLTTLGALASEGSFITRIKNVKRMRAIALAALFSVPMYLYDSRGDKDKKTVSYATQALKSKERDDAILD